ncbi:MAG: cyclase [Frankiales bacterium]|nr:cyclase [Frankiales bacterium]
MTTGIAQKRSTTPAAVRDDSLTRGLGWASAALGASQLVRPGAFARGLGVADAPRHRLVIAIVGAREMVAAAGLLGRPHPAWLWARVGGDAMDLTLLGRALKNHDGRGLRRTVLATAATVGITLTDLYAAITRTRKGKPMELRSSTTVAGRPDEVYGFWSRLDQLPMFMAHLEDVRVTGERRSHWRAAAPFSRDVEWDAETTDDVPGQRIAWRSLDGADIPNSGQVRFVPAPGGRGTEVHVTLTYDLPGGAAGKAVAKYFGEEPSQHLDDDLRRFKQVFETGEVIRSDGAPRGKRARAEFPQHPARPLSHEERKEVLT